MIPATTTKMGRHPRNTGTLSIPDFLVNIENTKNYTTKVQRKFAE
jgi:hypothetical protein